jgi:hypothetical protein
MNSSESVRDKMTDNEPPPPYPQANLNHIVPTPWNTGLGGGFGMGSPPGFTGVPAIVPYNVPPPGVSTTWNTGLGGGFSIGVPPGCNGMSGIFPYNSPLGTPNPYTSPPQPIGIPILYNSHYTGCLCNLCVSSRISRGYE